MMIVKIMGGDSYDDGSTTSTFTLHAGVKSVTFSRGSYGLGMVAENNPTAHILFEDGSQEDFFVPGNAYVMNSQGKTISSWGGLAYIGQPTPDDPEASDGPEDRRI